MIKKILKYIKEELKANYKFFIIYAVLLSLLFIKFDYYVYSPGGLEDLTDRIEVSNSYDSKGSFNLTYVTSRAGNIYNILLSYIIPSWDLVSTKDSQIENESTSEVVERNQIYLKQTSYDAIIAAFNEANIEYEVKNVNVTVTFVYDSSNTDIKIGDIIKEINGIKINSYEELSNEISKYKENDKISFKVLRDNKEIDTYAILKKENDRVIVGMYLAELKDVVTNPRVKYIFKDNESGSSRGLMCALDIYNKITEFDLTKGDIIAGTGVIYEDGSVGSIDGVKYKLKGAVKNKAKVFIVPSENYDEAIKLKKENNYDIEIIEADNLHNVIEKLKNR
jgi:Lon-like protease